MKPQEVPIYIVKIGQTKFSVREDLFRPQAGNIRYNIEHQMGFNLEDNWVRFVVRVFYTYPDNMNEILMDMVVETVFLLENLHEYVKVNEGPVDAKDMNVPPEILIKFADMGISHTRALLSQAKASTVYFSINLPYLDPYESAKRFFGSKVTNEIMTG